MFVDYIRIARENLNASVDQFQLNPVENPLDARVKFVAGAIFVSTSLFCVGLLALKVFVIPICLTVGIPLLVATGVIYFNEVRKCRQLADVASQQAKQIELLNHQLLHCQEHLSHPQFQQLLFDVSFFENNTISHLLEVDQAYCELMDLQTKQREWQEKMESIRQSNLLIN